MRNTDSASSLTGNILRVFSANLIIAIFGFIGSFIFPKILSIDSYVEYQTFLLYVGYIAITHLGFPSGMMVKYAGSEYEDIDNKQYKAEIKLLFGILISFSILFSIIALVKRDKIWWFLALVTFPNGICASYKSLLQAWNRFKAFGRLSTFLSVAIPCIGLIYYGVFKNLPGDIYIIIYIIIYWIATFGICIEIFRKISGAASNRVFSKVNWEIEKIGAIIVIGNYINVLFSSVDKQFVKIFYGNHEFAYYAFGLQMQAMMNIFISSISQPLFPAMAKGKFNKAEYSEIVHLLFIFGSLLGCAYFAASIIVKIFIKKYIPSLSVISIYFMAFPAMAVVNCLYVNLYKITGKMKEYIITLISVLLLAIVLNAIFIWIFHEYTAVAIATVITYYIWLLIGSFQFDFIEINIYDILYLICFVLCFYFITRRVNDWVGIFFFLGFDFVLANIFYKETFLKYFKRVIKR